MMRIELGPLTVELARHENPADFFRGLFRRIGNAELSEILGVTPRTVQRWRSKGVLPHRTNPMLLDVLKLLGNEGEWSGYFDAAGKPPHPTTCRVCEGPIVATGPTDVGS